MKTTLYIFLAAVIALTGCSEYEKEISWELDDYPDMLVVEGVITNEFKQQTVLLTKSSPYFDTQAPKTISGAGVLVREGSNTYFFTESSTNKGLYLSDIAFSGEPSKTYELEVTLQEPLNGLRDYDAVSKMPEGIDLDTIICEIYEMPDLGFEEDEEDKDTTILSIMFYGKEPDDPNNYYTARIFQNKTCWNANVKEVFLFNDDNNNGNNYDYFIGIENVQAEDTIMLEIRSVEKNYYDYVNGIKLIDESGDAYSMIGPAANAVGNISGGKALGYFCTAYVSRATSFAVDMRGKK
ncbi:MAG: DUF4249 domain-containing protein [Bacteroidales bacterium]|nr:DUF4249 domain-containing protein [Bacteroidales bacterium]